MLCRSRPDTFPAFRPGAEIKIGARGTHDRRPRVLRDHQPAERRLRLLDSIGIRPAMKNGVP